MKTLIALICFATMAVAAGASEPVQVMIVGDFHMSNPGRDMHNTEVDDMLSPKRQAEIAAVIDGLTAFQPTMVAAEWPADITSSRYAEFRAGTLKPSHNEVVQLGFRLAAKMNLTDVAGIDVDGDFPYEAVQAYADAHGMKDILDKTNADIARAVDSEEHLLKTGTVSQMLRWMNDPEAIAHGNEFYRTMLRIGGWSEQPGAELLTAWYKRNFLICANLIQRAKPGDRIVVFYGAGHSFLLRQCVSEMPGFVLVEPNAYLPK
ncbi:MAG: hypothetical protein JSR60_04170 [Proteobacteria bacterium]|nr:hypothetical protein [Pseudomonadota bacterium]